MIRANLDDARAHLSDLIDAAVRGEEVLIAADGVEETRIVKLVVVQRRTRRPKFGSARGLVSVAEDFDAPLPDFDEYK